MDYIIKNWDQNEDCALEGEHATYFAGHSFDPKDNLPDVHFYPESFYFPAGGASVHHLTSPGEATFARLTRRSGTYWLAILRGEFVQYDETKSMSLMKQIDLCRLWRLGYRTSYGG